MHRLGSPYGQCMVSTGSVDVQLLYNTSYTRQVSLGVEDGEAGQGPREGAGGAGQWEGGEAGRPGRGAAAPDPQLQPPLSP